MHLQCAFYEFLGIGNGIYLFYFFDLKAVVFQKCLNKCLIFSYIISIPESHYDPQDSSSLVFIGSISQIKTIILKRN